VTSAFRASRAYLFVVAIAVTGFGALVTRPAGADADADVSAWLVGPGGGTTSVFLDGALHGGEAGLAPASDATTPPVTG
jgi:hypothetical protein